MRENIEKSVEGKFGIGHHIRNFFYGISCAIHNLFHNSSKPKKLATMGRSKWRERGFVTFMLSFAIVNFLVFWVYVNFSSILLAFQKFDAEGNIKLTFDNFKQVFADFGSSSALLQESLVNTLIFFAVSLFVIFPLSLGISFFLYKKIWLYKFYRVVFFMPSIISSIALTVVFKTFIHSETGPLLPFLELLGFSGAGDMNLLGDSRYAMGTIVFYCVWTGLASNMVLFSGAMSRIPESIVESARIDGLGTMGELFKIAIPLIWPTISTILTFAAVGIFTASGPIMLFTNGDYGTFTISYFIFAKVFYFGEAWFSYTSALGLVFTFIGIPIVLLVKWGLSKIGQDIEY